MCFKRGGSAACSLVGLGTDKLEQLGNGKPDRAGLGRLLQGIMWDDATAQPVGDSNTCAVVWCVRHDCCRLMPTSAR